MHKVWPEDAQEGPEARSEAKSFQHFEQGIRPAMTETAERLGSVVGNAQRNIRRGLELFRGSKGSAEQLANQGIDQGSRFIRDIGEEIGDVRRQAENAIDELSQLAEERFQQLRFRTRSAIFRSRDRARWFAERHPWKTMLLITGVGFMLGAAFRASKGRRD
ncbi:MAG: hypothetical protein CXZ00_10875 [Acidobacteria bacterium]|nr:MAG: hypothetical protein CXZ00_10875 [Acidobacteriota bacterium]